MMSNESDFGSSKQPLPEHLRDKNSPATLKQQLEQKDSALLKILEHTRGRDGVNLALNTLARSGLSASPAGKELLQTHDKPSDKTATVTLSESKAFKGYDPTI